jgi:predicted AlkP superfamily pyrophosphatase or phosphodiesterase
LFFGHDLPAAVANLASMLPSVPKSFGRLSEAYLSAFLALNGKPNPLSLPSKQSYAVILVDGLGVSNIKSAGAHAGFLNQKLSNSVSLFSGFPTTTATSLASLATGKANGEHAFIGYRVFDREKQRAINLLNDLGVDLPPNKYQDLETISAQAIAIDKTVITVGPGEYANSGFTKATMPAATYLAAQSIGDRFKVAARELSKPGTLLYLYVPELDQVAHRLGTQSRKWLETIEELDSELASFSRGLPSGAGALLTADHGVIDVDQSRHVYLEELESLEELSMIGGDPRCGYLYFPNHTDLISKRAQLTTDLVGLADVVTVQELVETGWLHALSATASKVAPDLIILPKGDRVIYQEVPLLVF